MVSKVSKDYKELETQSWGIRDDNNMDVGIKGRRDEGRARGMGAIDKMQGCRSKRNGNSLWLPQKEVVWSVCRGASGLEQGLCVLATCGRVCGPDDGLHFLSLLKRRSNLFKCTWCM